MLDEKGRLMGNYLHALISLDSLNASAMATSETVSWALLIQSLCGACLTQLLLMSAHAYHE